MSRKKDALEFKVFPFVVDETKDNGERVIAGHANVYGIKDEVGDIVEAGTFKRSLQHDDVRSLLWQHDSRDLIGDGEFEDTDAALVLTEGKLYKDVQRADEAYAIAKQARKPLGLSIGFSITSGGAYTDDDGVRHITEAKLHEVSLVTFPANTQSTITSVKADEMCDGCESGCDHSPKMEDGRCVHKMQRETDEGFVAAFIANAQAMVEVEIDEEKRQEVIEVMATLQAKLDETTIEDETTPAPEEPLTAEYVEQALQEARNALALVGTACQPLPN